MNAPTPSPPTGISGRLIVVLLILAALGLAVMTVIVNRPALDGPSPDTPFRPPSGPPK